MADFSTLALGVGDGLQYLGLALSPLLLAPLVVTAMPGLAPMALRAASAIDSISKALLAVAGWLGFLMAVAMLANVVLRYVYGVGYGWARDSWVYAFAGCFLLASAGALYNAAHVRVDILFSGFDLKRRATVDLVGTLLFLFPLMILILVAYAPQLAYAWGSATGRLELSSETDGLPGLFLFKTLVPVFAVSMIIQGWSNAIKAAAILRGVETSAPALAGHEGPTT